MNEKNEKIYEYTEIRTLLYLSGSISIIDRLESLLKEVKSRLKDGDDVTNWWIEPVDRASDTDMYGNYILVIAP